MLGFCRYSLWNLIFTHPFGLYTITALCKIQNNKTVFVYGKDFVHKWKFYSIKIKLMPKWDRKVI